jgi:hypothetical protein
MDSHHNDWALDLHLHPFLQCNISSENCIASMEASLSRYVARLEDETDGDAGNNATPVLCQKMHTGKVRGKQTMRLFLGFFIH